MTPRPFRFTTAFVGFEELGGPAVTGSELVEEIARHPIDGLLGTIAGISLALINASDATDPRVQGGWMNLAIADDFPAVLPRAASMYAPGRVPFTGGRHVFIHEQNLAWLVNEVLLHGDEGRQTALVGPEIQRRTCRLLLIANDHLRLGRQSLPVDLESRRQFCLDWLRAGQFNLFMGDSLHALRSLERQRILYSEILPRHYPRIRDVFEAVYGLSLESYFQVLALVVTQARHTLAPGQHWMRASTLAAGLERDRAPAERLIRRWTRTPSEYRTAAGAWRAGLGGRASRPFDTTLLRQTPIVEGRPDELVVPVPSFLVAKMLDDAYFTISEHLESHPAERGRFQEALGRSFETYGRDLVRRISDASAGSKRLQALTRDGIEVTDAYIQQAGVGVAFEMKALRAPTDFLIGGSGDRVLGPSSPIVRQIESRQVPSPRQGRNADEGLLTKGLWQLTAAGGELLDLAQTELATRPTRVFPVIVHLAPLRVDDVVRGVFLDHLVGRASLLSESWWEAPLWLHVEDLESLVGLAERGEDIVLLLVSMGDADRRGRFDAFLNNRFGTRGTDSRLDEGALRLLQDSAAHFFPSQHSRA
jgi:hypothetical protein